MGHSFTSYGGGGGPGPGGAVARGVRGITKPSAAVGLPGMLVSSLPTTLPTLLSLAAASGAASRNGLGGVRADAGAQPPLVVVGAGVLGRLAAQEWQELHPGGCEVLGVTRTRPDEEREAAMRAEGITHRYRSDIEASVRSGTPTLTPTPTSTLTLALALALALARCAAARAGPTSSLARVPAATMITLRRSRVRWRIGTRTRLAAASSSPRPRACAQSRTVAS